MGWNIRGKLPVYGNRMTHRTFFALPVVALLGLLPQGCATIRSPKPDKPPARELFMEPLHIGLKPDPELGLTDFDAATLFREGLHIHQGGDCGRALVFYERLLKEFGSSRYLSAAAFNAGRCLEELDHPADAIKRYSIITGQLPRSKDWLDAGFRQSMCLSSLNRHDEAIQLLGRMLDRDNLSTSDRIDAMVLLGESLTASSELFDAERTYRAALRLFRERTREEYLDPQPAARAEFRLGEMAEERFLAAPLRLPEEQMEIDLEAKAQLLLDAQAGYLRTIRHGDPEWATAAGYRIGTLYLHLHEAMERAPVPPDLAADEAEVYRDLLRKRTAVLLRKALRVFEMTIELAERTRSENRHTRAAREEMKRIEAQVLSLYEHLPSEEP
jgi:tetratricopeptide (TPR) repeat protein